MAAALVPIFATCQNTLVGLMFPLRQLVRTSARVLPSVRPMSASAGPLVDLAVDSEGIATLTMQHPPLNSMNLNLLQELIKSLDDVERNACKGLILSSALPTVFSAGLDVNEMYKPDMKRAEAFGIILQDLWLKLFNSKFITAAAINGHAPGSGCIVSLACEYRVMVSGKGIIGLSETNIGLTPPSWFVDTMRHTISTREAEFALTSGRMFTVDEALKVGLIDQTATDKADAVTKCRQFIKKFDRIPPFARAITKQNVRATYVNNFQRNRQQDFDTFMKFIQDPAVQETMGQFVEKQKKKTGK